MPGICFNFNQEAHQAYLHFPQLRKNVGFTDFSDPSRTIIRSDRNYTAAKSVKRKLKKDGTCVATTKRPDSEEKLLLLAFFPKKILKANNETVDKFFTFDHEVGHCLTDGEPSIFHENVADAFAAIRCLQRFGKPEYLVIISAARSLNLMKFGDVEHVSSPLLNQIVRDAGHVDFASLSPQETIQKAKEYAERLTQTQEELLALNGMRINRLSWFLPQKLSIKYHARKAFRKRAPLATDIGTSLINPFLTPEGADFRGKHVKFSPKEQAKLQKRLQKSLARRS